MESGGGVDKDYDVLVFKELINVGYLLFKSGIFNFNVLGVCISQLSKTIFLKIYSNQLCISNKEFQ